MTLDELEKVILSRRETSQENSYVSFLFAKGKDAILRKIGEESIEVILASKEGDKKNLIHELADLWFHCMVLMAEEGISHGDIFEELQKRASRKKETLE